MSQDALAYVMDKWGLTALTRENVDRQYCELMRVVDQTEARQQPIDSLDNRLGEIENERKFLMENLPASHH